MPISSDPKRGTAKDARQLAYQTLKGEILDLRRLPGDKLSEAELAAQLDMSRTPVRDVLARLTRERLVELFPQRGAFVSRIDPVRVEQAAWACRQAGIAMLDVLYVRHLGGSDFLLLEHHLARVRAAIGLHDYPRAVRELTRFHQVLYRLAELTLAWDSLAAYACDFSRVLLLDQQNELLWNGLLLECAGIVEGLSQRNHIEAARALRHQVARIWELARRMREQHPDCFVRFA